VVVVFAIGSAFRGKRRDDQIFNPSAQFEGFLVGAAVVAYGAKRNFAPVSSPFCCDLLG